MNCFLPARKAFTLLEIMIVIAVIGIIIAIAMPAFLRARTMSSARGCQENLAQIDGAMDMYAIEKKLKTGASISLEELHNTDGTGYLRSEPVCPASGTYTVTKVDLAPTCSIGENPTAPYAPHIIDRPIPFTE